MLTLILARAQDNTIGNDNTLPWRIKSDLKRFKSMTMGKHLVMGRKTYDSLPGKKLPGRVKIVLSRDLEFHPKEEDVHIYRDYRDVLHLSEVMDLYVIGGAEIYKLFLPYSQYIYETLVHASPDGDTKWSTHINNEDWAAVYDTTEPIQEEGDEHSYDLIQYTKVNHMDDDELMMMFIQEEMHRARD